jgi:hypothetical protein
MAADAGSVNGTTASPALETSQKPSVTPNVLEVVFGSLLIKPWYPSFYPEQIVGRKVERLYVCQWCFKYSKELLAFLGHLVCLMRSLQGSPLRLCRKHVRTVTHHRQASMSTPKTISPCTKSTAKETSSIRRTYASLQSCFSIPSQSSTTSQPSSTTCLLLTNPRQAYQIPTWVRTGWDSRARSWASSVRRR